MVENSALPSEPRPPDRSASEELPTEAEADLVPLKENSAGPSPEEIDPYQQESVDAVQAFQAAVHIAEEQDEARAVQEFLKAATIAEKAHEWYLAAVALQRVGDYLCKSGHQLDLERALRLYRRAEAAYEHCGLFGEARELSGRVLYAKMRHARLLGVSLPARLELFFFWATSGFGVRPLRVLGLGLFFVVFFGILFWAIGGVVQAGTRQTAGLWESLYFSGVTFATIGYGDFLPVPRARSLALAEGVLGVITMSYFVVVLANRLGKT
jgi:Ion channel